MKQFFKNLFNKSSNAVNNMVTPKWTATEQSFYDIISAMVAKAKLNDLHCDTTEKKYYVINGNRILIIDGSTNKVYILIESETDTDECSKAPYSFVIRDSVVVEYIDLIAQAKHVQTEKLYQKVKHHEAMFLDCLKEKVENFK